MRDVVGYEESYCVNENGDVFSKDRIDASGHVRSGIKRKLGIRKGYLKVNLSKNGIKK